MSTDQRVADAARAVHEGGVIAYPTEAVWGLGCDPWNRTATERLLHLKQRPMEKGLIVIAGHRDQFSAILANLPEEWVARLDESWPGPNTWLVPHQNLFPEWVTGEHPTVALRVTNHPLVQQLCAQTGPIISTSANLAGEPAARSYDEVADIFAGQTDYILNGELGGNKNPSLIRDLASGAIVRPA